MKNKLAVCAALCAMAAMISASGLVIDSCRYALSYEMGWIQNPAVSNIRMPLAGTM